MQDTFQDQIDYFATLPTGEDVHQVRLVGGGLAATVLTYGASLQDLRLDGVAHPLVLGAPTIEPYLGPLCHAGALVGRFANRIDKGAFAIDGVLYQVPVNFRGRHALHGGANGTSLCLWTIIELGRSWVEMQLILPDGHMGFPGEIDIRAKISLAADGALAFDLSATTTKATLCSIAHHSYFNLGGTNTINNHLLEVQADGYLPIDDDLIPLGQVDPVAGHAYDFRAAKLLADTFIDHNFCLSESKQPCRVVACLSDPTAGVMMEVATNEVGLQIYTGDGLDLPKGQGLDGRGYGARAGIALETQAWPDAPNQPDFPSAVLRPDTPYAHTAVYRFSRLNAVEDPTP